jgi:hypothetical protein
VDAGQLLEPPVGKLLDDPAITLERPIGTRLPRSVVEDALTRLRAPGPEFERRELRRFYQIDLGRLEEQAGDI